MGATVVGAGAEIGSAAAVPQWGWGYGGSSGAPVADAAIGGVSQAVAQSATNQQIEAAMGNCRSRSSPHHGRARPGHFSLPAVRPAR
ncbi:MAG TPA: hypothetical protein VIL09_10180 [Microvirga sp.]